MIVGDPRKKKEKGGKERGKKEIYPGRSSQGKGGKKKKRRRGKEGDKRK